MAGLDRVDVHTENTTERKVWVIGLIHRWQPYLGRSLVHDEFRTVPAPSEPCPLILLDQVKPLSTPVETSPLPTSTSRSS